MVSPAWRKRAGRYLVRNPDPNLPNLQLQLSFRNGFLFLKNPNLGGRILIPVNDSEAVMAGLGRALGETVSAEDEPGDTELRYSGYRFRRD